MCIFDDILDVPLTFQRIHEFWYLYLNLAVSRNAAVSASLGFKSLTPPTMHVQFDSKALHAKTKFEKGASDRNSHPCIHDHSAPASQF